jgi:ParB family chromosome partitioning protein
MLDLEEPLQDLVAADELSSGHAKVLLGIEPGSIRVDMGRRAATGGWSVRRLEAEVGRIRGARASAGAGVSNLAHVADLERQLSEHLGTRVRIVTDRTGAKGRMEISFYDLDHFDGLMSQIGFTLR